VFETPTSLSVTGPNHAHLGESIRERWKTNRGKEFRFSVITDGRGCPPTSTHTEMRLRSPRLATPLYRSFSGTPACTPIRQNSKQDHDRPALRQPQGSSPGCHRNAETLAKRRHAATGERRAKAQRQPASFNAPRTKEPRKRRTREKSAPMNTRPGAAGMRASTESKQACGWQSPIVDLSGRLPRSGGMAGRQGWEGKAGRHGWEARLGGMAGRHGWEARLGDMAERPSCLPKKSTFCVGFYRTEGLKAASLHSKYLDHDSRFRL
jgi:hypothetical protein